LVVDDDPLLLGLLLDGLLEEPPALEGLEHEPDGLALEGLLVEPLLLEPGLMPLDDEPLAPLSPACHSL
jgi:hypothetical protein